MHCCGTWDTWKKMICPFFLQALSRQDNSMIMLEVDTTHIITTWGVGPYPLKGLKHSSAACTLELWTFCLESTWTDTLVLWRRVPFIPLLPRPRWELIIEGKSTITKGQGSTYCIVDVHSLAEFGDRAQRSRSTQLCQATVAAARQPAALGNRISQDTGRRPWPA